MLHYEALLQLCLERAQRMQDEAAAERLALQARRQGQRRGRRPALRATLRQGTRLGSMRVPTRTARPRA